MNGRYQNLGARCNATMPYRNVMREGSASLPLAFQETAESSSLYRHANDAGRV